MANYQQGIPEKFRTSKEELDAFREKVAQYLTVMMVIKEMYEKGIINKDDYVTSEEIMAEKYGLTDKSIYRRRDPNASDNIRSLHTKEKRPAEDNG